MRGLGLMGRDTGFRGGQSLCLMPRLGTRASAGGGRGCLRGVRGGASDGWAGRHHAGRTLQGLKIGPSLGSGRGLHLSVPRRASLGWKPGGEGGRGAGLKEEVGEGGGEETKSGAMLSHHPQGPGRALEGATAGGGRCRGPWETRGGGRDTWGQRAYF